MAQRRLAWLEKYLVKIFGVLAALYLLGMGYWLFSALRTIDPGATTLAGRETLLGCAAYLSGFGLVSFLFSRYAVGLSQQSPWRPLRAGGSYLFSNALASFFLAIVLMVSNYGYLLAEKVLSYVLVVLLLALGVEIILNLLLDALRTVGKC